MKKGTKVKSILNKLVATTDFERFVLDSLIEQSLDYSNVKSLLKDNSDPEGGINGITYYEETTNTYDKHIDDIHAIISGYYDEIGGEIAINIDDFGELYLFKNYCVWLAWKIVIKNLIRLLEV